MRLVICCLALVLAGPAGSGQTLFMVEGHTLYGVNPAAGFALPVGQPGGITVPQPTGLAHSGTRLYTIDPSGAGFNGPLWELDPTSGSPTYLGETGLLGWVDIAWDYTRNAIVSFRASTLYEIDTSANATVLAPISASVGLQSLAVDQGGVLWATGGGVLGTLDRATGVFSPVTVLSTPGISLISFHPTNGTLYGVASASGDVHTIDTATGQTSLLGALGSNLQARGLSWEFAGVTAAVTPVGTGCPGANGAVPFLSNVPTQLPVVGNASFALQVQASAPQRNTFWFLADAAVANALPVAPGCSVHLDVTSLLGLWAQGVNPIAVLLADAAGYTALSLPVPNDPALIGATFGLQVLVDDPAAAPGFALTRALEARVGS